MTRLVFHLAPDKVPDSPDPGEIHVLLYAGSAPYRHVGTVGGQAINAARRLGVPPSVGAMDFLAIAMAVTAADTFVKREDADDAWSRTFEIVLPLGQPERWQPLQQGLESTLRFLSGDQWSFEFKEVGAKPPTIPEIRLKQKKFDPSKIDCVTLFSGGLDSAVGAIDLIQQGRRPLLSSHAPRGDSDRQAAVGALLPLACERLAINTYPTLAGVDEDSMRTRSFQFLALAALAADALATLRGEPNIELFLCENGLIALNPPLTPRRLGSHSTRTAHPCFLSGVRELLAAASIPATIINPYEHKTKGEMLAPHSNNAQFSAIAAETVSCGKWKRKNQQCGRCVPCLIRRASLHAAGIPDATSYQSPNLMKVMVEEGVRDDLVAVQAAIVRLSNGDAERWVLQAGPLPPNAVARASFVDVARRGTEELSSFLRAQGFSL